MCVTIDWSKDGNDFLLGSSCSGRGYSMRCCSRKTEYPGSICGQGVHTNILPTEQAIFNMEHNYFYNLNILVIAFTINIWIFETYYVYVYIINFY